jgi:hypothetical protein
MTQPRNPTEGAHGKAEDNGDMPDSVSPLDRFKSLARRIIYVPKHELQERAAEHQKEKHQKH